MPREIILWCHVWMVLCGEAALTFVLGTWGTPYYFC